MRLRDLLHCLDPDVYPANAPEIEITGVQEDSRKVGPGTLFVARTGTKTDGLKYVNDARSRGAAAVVTETRLADCTLPQIVVKDAALAGSVLANAFYDFPGRRIKVLGVTGTNGKTTTAYIIRHLLARIGRKCGMIGTVQIDDGQSVREATMTTPSSTEVAELLGRMRDNGCAACAIETSSHALDQKRVAGVQFAGGAFTNLTGDHLDYHKTMENYAAAKSKLFEMLAADAVAVVNAADPFSPRMLENCLSRVVRFGFTPDADYRATDVSITAEGSSFMLRTPRGMAQVRMHLIGRHNIENVLTAAALVGETFELSPAQLADGLADAQGAPGRLQAVRCNQPFAVLVDYAHTDDALENVLLALRPLTSGRLRVLFGCGGDRDRTKRPRMARVAEKLADVVYLTSDNPRTENAQEIINEVFSGFSADIRKAVIIEADRRKAIERVLGEAQAGDVVLLAGKGHENYQIVGTQKQHFDDVEEAARVLKIRFAGRN